MTTAIDTGARTRRLGKLAAASGVVAALFAGGIAAPAFAASPTPASSSMDRVAAAAAAAVPTPEDPEVLYLEDFENTSSAVALSDYVGLNGTTYGASADWLDYCNGWVASSTDAQPAQAAMDCQDGAWQQLIGPLSDAIGALHGAVPGSNRAVSASSDPYPESGDWGWSLPGGASQTEFETAGAQIPVPSGRFLTFSVDAAAVTCVGEYGFPVSIPGEDPAYMFYLTGAGDPIAVIDDKPINPCVTPPGGITDPDGVGWGPLHSGTYYSDGSVLYSGTALGIRLVNGSGSRQGNDAAFDNIRVVDVTPTLHKAFSEPDTAKTSTLTFTVVNTSELSAKRGWSFVDTLDSNLRPDPASVATTCTNGSVSIDGQALSVAGDLDSGQASCEVSVSVTAAATGSFDNCPGTHVTDVVGLDGPECATLVVGDYTVSKSSDPASGSLVGQGDVIGYSLHVEPTTDSPAGAVIPFDVTDSMSDVLAEAVYNGDATASAGTFTVAPGGDIVWTGSIPHDQGATLTFSVTIKPYADGVDHQADNFVVKTGGTPPPTCEDGDDTCTEHPIAPPAAVTIVKDDHRSVIRPGESTTYEIVVTNTSPTQTATGVVVTDVLPAELAFESAADGGVYDAAAHTVSWDIGDLPADTALTLTVTGAVKSGTPSDTDIANVATVTTDQGCTDPATCESTDVDRTPPAVTIVKDDHRTVVAPGDRTTYDLSVTNTSSLQKAEEVVVTDTLPAELTFESASDGGVYDADAHAVTWNLGDLAAAAVRTVHVTAVVKVGTPTDVDITNVALVDTKYGCEDTATCESTDVDITPPDVSIEKDDHKTVVGLGEELTYDLTVRNHSARTDATSVVVTDELPAQLAFVSASDGGVYDADTHAVTWNLGTLAAGDDALVQVTAIVKDETPAGDTIVNRATATTDEGCLIAEDCETGDTDHTPDVSIVKDDHKTVVAPGQQLDYDLTVTNRAEWAATGVVVADELPANTTFVSASDGGAYDSATRTVTWNLGDLAGGAEKVVRVSVTVSQDVTDGDTVINHASVTTDQGCFDEDGCTTSDTDRVDPPAIALAQTGQTIAWSLIALAGGLALGGAVLLVIRRRRESTVS